MMMKIDDENGTYDAYNADVDLFNEISQKMEDFSKKPFWYRMVHYDDYLMLKDSLKMLQSAFNGLKF